MDTITPFDWQDPLWRWVQDSLTRDRLAISGFPTGAGKTVIALAAAKAMARPVLVVAPKVTLTQWWMTAAAMDCRGIVGIINPEKISTPRGCEFYTRDLKWRLPKNCHVIWDEPHRSASGIKGVTTLALAELKAYGACLHAMSATVADSPLKLRALGWWAGLHGFTKPSFYGWCRANGCKDVDIGYGSGCAGRTAFQFTKNRAEAQAVMAAIRRGLGDRFRSMRPEDIPGFPTETIDIDYIDIDANGRAAVDAAYAEMSERMRSQAGSGMAEMGRERERVEFVMAEALAERAAAVVDEGSSVVVFLNFTEPRLRFVAKYTDITGIEPAQVYGGQTDAARERDRLAFQTNAVHCIVVNQQAGGAGLNLHDELKQRPRWSLYVPGWKAEDVKQCFGRIRRCNGTHANQRFAIAAGTIQERVAATLKRKLGNIDALNDADLL